MQRVHWLLLLGWLAVLVAPAPMRADCCACINCVGGAQCFPVASSTICSGAFCAQNGCPNSQVQGVQGDCSNSLFCPASTPTPAAAPAPALSSPATAAALLVLAALSWRALQRGR
jgi:hypothetical protein